MIWLLDIWRTDVIVVLCVPIGKNLVCGHKKSIYKREIQLCSFHRFLKLKLFRKILSEEYTSSVLLCRKFYSARQLFVFLQETVESTYNQSQHSTSPHEIVSIFSSFSFNCKGSFLGRYRFSSILGFNVTWNVWWVLPTSNLCWQ